MPRINVVFYKEDDGTCPALEWLRRKMPKIQDKCRIKLKRLSDLGYELRRPEADLLRDGIYELRIVLQGIQYRILYFYHNNTAAVVSHGIIKVKSGVPPIEIERAIARKLKFESNPAKHTYERHEA